MQSKVADVIDKRTGKKYKSYLAGQPNNSRLGHKCSQPAHIDHGFCPQRRSRSEIIFDTQIHNMCEEQLPAHCSHCSCCISDR